MWWWLIAGAVTLLAASTASASIDNNTDENDDVTNSPKAVLYAKLRALPQLTEDQRLFIMLVAYGETAATWKPTAWNNTPGEVEASQKAWDNNPKLARRLEQCGAGGRDAWALGSGGYGGRLIPYFGDDMLDIGGLPCSPRGVFDPDLSIVSTILTAWKLQQNAAWKNSAKTVGNLRVGYYGPGYMDDPPADRIAKYERHAEAVRLPPGFVQRVLPEFPGPDVSKSIYSILRGVA